MYLETMRMVTDYLKDPTYGVNALLPDVPRDADDPQPSLIAMENDGQTLAIYDETRHKWVATKQDPPALPALYVMSEGDLPLTGSPTPDGQVRLTTTGVLVVIRYLTECDDPERAVQDGYYTLRAVLRSLRHLCMNENAASRERNSVQLTVMEDPVRYVPLDEAIGHSRASGAVVAVFNARDVAP